MNELVNIVNNQVVTDSRKVAEVFEKEHKNVIQSIENIKAENSALTTMFSYQILQRSFLIGLQIQFLGDNQGRMPGV